MRNQSQIDELTELYLSERHMKMSMVKYEYEVQKDTDREMIVDFAYIRALEMLMSNHPMNISGNPKRAFYGLIKKYARIYTGGMEVWDTFIKWFNNRPTPEQIKRNTEKNKLYLSKIQNCPKRKEYITSTLRKIKNEVPVMYDQFQLIRNIVNLNRSEGPKA